ncbi:WD_REPEATS_REGION domain-containing protein [Linnemannia zychae]|nr:WD_REPEATS_REGION domain-containing protein [Linnemannia zychae]
MRRRDTWRIGCKMLDIVFIRQVFKARRRSMDREKSKDRDCQTFVCFNPNGVLLEYGLGLMDTVVGMQDMRESAHELERFVQKVLTITGAQHVDLVGHAEGSLVSMNHEPDSNIPPAPAEPSNEGGVKYLMVMTNEDEVVTPFLSGYLDDTEDETKVKHVVVEDICEYAVTTYAMSAYAQYILKRDKFLKLFRSSGPNPMVKSHSNNPKDIVRDSTAHTDSTRLHHLPTASVNARIIDTVSESAQSSLEIEHVVTNTAVKGPATNTESSTIRTKPRLYVFNQNVNPPSVRVSLPKIRARIDSTPQLALCIGFINNDSDTIGTVDQQRDILQDMNPDTTARLAWIEAVKQDPIEQDHIRWLGARMVDEFAKGASKDSTAIAEMVLLGPVLDNETYRRLLEGFASALADSIVLDVDLLQGLVQLVQSNPSNSLLSTDLIKILRILRIRLQDTRQQSSEHLFHLTLAVSRVSDIMADHKAKGLNHVVEHEPLSRILVGLKGCSEPYLIYQTCYAFQALQYVLGDETALQRVLRHSSGVIGGLAKVSAVFKLDVSAVIEGLGNLQETLGGDIGIANTVYGGALSLLESGQGVFDSLKVGYGSSQQRPWYSAIRAANAFARSGQLKDLNQLICEAPCRDDPLFQWGICQLLGEIASDTIWDNVVRQGAITLLGELHKNDVEWGQDESVIAWMQNIFRQLSIVDDQVVKNTAYSLLKDVKQEQVTVPCVFYPLRNQLPLPTSSPILVRVQNIPYIEYDLHLLKIQRLEQSTRPVYIPPLASLNTTDKDIFPLMEKVQEFLQSKRQVMLVLGDSGAGKSTFNGHLEHRLWMDYKPGDSVPLLINLPAIDRPDQDLITKQLRIYNFRDDQIQEFKLHRRLILICDGYDESQQLVNLHKTNMLNTPGQWNTKMIVSCRTQFLGRTYLDYFKPQPVDRYLSVSQDLFQEAVIAPFSKDQIKSYVEQYAQDPQVEHSFNNSEAAWSAKVYMDKLVAIPNVMDLAKNPFLLTLALKTLPTLSHEDRRMMDQLVDAGFVSLGNDYSTRLAQAIFDHQDGNPLVHYVHLYDKKSWMVEFFGLEPEARLLRESSPLTRAGNSFSFFHRSLLEYFFSRTIYNPTNPLFKRDLLQEPSVIAFLCDRVKLNPRFKDQLRAVIDLSKTDSSAAVAATNAITILVRADVSFNSEDLRGIKVPGADLSNGQFDSAQFQGADLRGVNLSKSWLRQADMSDAYMENVRFGELPYLEMDDEVYSCTYSPDGKMLGVGLGNGIICVYDTSTWTQMHHLDRHVQVVRSIAFSPSSQRLVSGSRDNTVRLWDTASGEELLVMEGHSDSVNSVTISPCGNLIASASSDKTVRLWDAQTGEKLFVLEDHSASVEGVKSHLADVTVKCDCGK